MLSLEAHLGITASPQAPFPTDFVTVPVSASHRRFGSLPLAAEEGHTPVLQQQLLRLLHSNYAQATSPPYRRATLAGRTVGLVHAPAVAYRALAPTKGLLEHRQQLDHPAMHRGMIHLDAALGHHLFQIPQACEYATYLRTHSRITSTGCFRRLRTLAAMPPSRLVRGVFAGLFIC